MGIVRTSPSDKNYVFQFKGNDYGDVRVCAFDRTSNSEEDKTCKTITMYGEVAFRALDYCGPSLSSCTVGFIVDATSSKVKCAGGHGNPTNDGRVNELHFSETDCRYPDQIRLDVYTEWTTRSGSSAPQWWSLAAVVFVIGAIMF